MRKSFKPAILAALVATAVAAPAFATGDGGDNGMTPWYGDSWTNVQSKAPEATAVPSLQAQEEKVPAMDAWGHARDDMRARTAHMRETTSNAFHRMTGTAAPADHSTGVATTDRTVDSTGVGAAPMGASPYGSNQDPARLPSSSSTSTDVMPRGR